MGVGWLKCACYDVVLCAVICLSSMFICSFLSPDVPLRTVHLWPPPAQPRPFDFYRKERVRERERERCWGHWQAALIGRAVCTRANNDEHAAAMSCQSEWFYPSNTVIHRLQLSFADVRRSFFVCFFEKSCHHFLKNQVIDHFLFIQLESRQHAFENLIIKSTSTFGFWTDELSHLVVDKRQ